MQEVTTLVKNLSLMNVRFSRRWLGMPLIFLLSLIITIGCTTVVTPLKPGAVTSLETPEETPDHGYVRGRVHLQWNGKPQTVGQFPYNMNGA